MPDVSQVKATWNFSPGGPGTSTFHFEPLSTPTAVQAAVDAVRVFFSAFVTYLKTTWTIQVSPLVSSFDIATGVLTGESTAGSTPPVLAGTGLTSASYAGGTGLRISWNTGAIFNGHHIHGATYMVPLQNVSDPDGTLLASVITAATNAGNGLINNSSAHLAIWARVFDRTVTPPVQTSGSLARATSCTVADKAAILRSRRD